MQLIMNKLKAVTSRWNQIFLLSWIVKGIAIGGAVPLLLLLVGRLLPIAHLERLSALLWVVVALIIWGWQWRKRYKTIDAARLVDKDIGEDVVVTALELNSKEQQSFMSSVITEQAIQATSRYADDVKRKLPLYYGWKHKKWILFMSLTIVVVGALLVIPNKQNVIAQERIEQEQIVEQLTEELQEMMEALEQSTVAEEQKEQLLSSMEQLREQLEEDMKFSLEHAKQLAEQLEQLKQLHQDARVSQAEVEEMKQAFEQKAELAELSEALSEASKGTKEQLQQGIQQSLEQMDVDQLEQLKQTLDKGGEQGNKTMEQLADSLQAAMNGEAMDELAAQLADLLSSEQTASLADQLSNQLQNEMGAINSMMNNNTSQAAIKEALKKALSQAQQMQNDSNSNNSNGQPNSSNQGNSQSGQNQTGSNPTGNGQNGSNPGVDGQSGSSGQGAGNGQGQQNGGGGGQGAGLGSGNHANVTTPRKFAGESDPTLDNGETTGGDVVSGGSSPITDGTQGNYSEVFSEYEREAKDSLTRSNIPDHMQGKVKQYFDAISPSSR